MCRAYYYDQTTYNAVKSAVDLKKLHEKFYEYFDKCFCEKYGKVNCVKSANYKYNS